MLLRVLIVDDESPARQELRYLLNQLGNVEVVGEAASAVEAMKLIRVLEYDILFLDINLPGMNGLELAENVQSMPNKPQIIFITAYDDYALDAFNVSAVDYILKPIELTRLKRAVDKVVERNRAKVSVEVLPKTIPNAAAVAAPTAEIHNVTGRIVAESNGKIIVVDVEDICFAYTESDKVYLKIGTEKLLTRYTMSALEKRLDSGMFFRTHRSFLVNIQKVREIQPFFNGTYKLIMNDKEKSEVPVSRNQATKLRKLLG